MSKQPETVTENWTATGTRVTSQNKRAQAFLTPPDGDERLYAERASYVIGGIYRVRVRYDGGRAIRVGEPEYTGDRAATAERAAWEAATRASEAELERFSLERKHKNDSVLDDAIAPLELIAAGMRTGAQREGLISLVSQRVNAAYYREREKRLQREAQQAGREAAEAIAGLRKLEQKIARTKGTS